MARFSAVLRTTLVAVLLAGVIGAGTAGAQVGSGGIGTTPGGEPGPAATSAEGTFPVRGRHTYGDGLGAGRGHQGQDLLASCGKRVVAAQPGRVRVKDYQASGAGNYVVVKGSGYDYVYMHMLSGVAVSKGDRLEAGDTIGRVGSTGRSSACHLHFEMWSSPGWYRGGSVVDPRPSLKQWDRTS